MERWAKKQAKNKESARPQSATQAAQDAVKESTYQYDPNDLKVSTATQDLTHKVIYSGFQKHSPPPPREIFNNGYISRGR